MIEKLISLLEYLIIYVVSIFLFSMADGAKRLSTKKRFILAGVLFLSLIGGLRSLDVGTDTLSTVQIYFDSYRFHGLGSLIQDAGSTPIYYLIAIILKGLGLGSAAFLFVMQLLIVFPIAIVAYKRREQTSIALTMTFYLLLYYQLSFNWIRQGIAVSFVFLAVTCYQQDKKAIKTILLFILAFLFHKSAVLGIAIYIIIHFYVRFDNRYFRGFVLVAVLAIAAVVMWEWKTISLWLIEKGILPKSYIGYVNVFSGAHGNTFRGWFVIGTMTYVEYFFRVVFYLFPFLLLKFKKKRKLTREKLRSLNFYSTVSLFSVLIYSVAFWGLHTAYANRLTFYLDIANPIFFGLSYYRPVRRQHMKINLNNLILVAMCVAYNLLLYYMMGWHGTVPLNFFGW